MGKAWSGLGQGPGGPEALGAAGGAGPADPGPPEWRDWAGGLPAEVLERVAVLYRAQTEAGWAAQLKEWGLSEENIQETMARQKREGNCLLVFALVCKGWRRAQLKVRGRCVQWLRGEGCPRDWWTCRIAVATGDVEMLRFARENGCPWDAETRDKATATLGYIDDLGNIYEGSDGERERG